MPFPRSPKIAACILLLATGHALAEDAGHAPAAAAAEISEQLSETVGEAGANAASTAEGIEIELNPSVRLPRVSFETPQETIRRFLFPKTVQPKTVAQYASEWITAGSNAAAYALQHPGRWVAAGSSCVASAARTASEWIAANSKAAVFAFQDLGAWAEPTSKAVQIAGEWVASGADAVAFAARDSGEWVSLNSSATVNLMAEAASATMNGLTTLEDWSVNLVKEIESHLRADGTSEFAILVKESGFVLTDIKVGVGIIPELAVEFKHESDLTPAQAREFKVKVDAYTRTAPGVIGYLEGVLLRRLLKAGQYSGGMRINELHVDLFPLPGLEVFFDPFEYEEEQNKMLVDAAELAKSDTENLKVLEERVSKIETMIPNLQTKK